MLRELSVRCDFEGQAISKLCSRSREGGLSCGSPGIGNFGLEEVL